MICQEGARCVQQLLVNAIPLSSCVANPRTKFGTNDTHAQCQVDLALVDRQRLLVQTH